MICALSDYGSGLSLSGMDSDMWTVGYRSDGCALLVMEAGSVQVFVCVY